MFQPINKDSNRFYEDIIENIKMMIMTGKLKQGEKLPSERELAEYFNVSRIPVREALKILEYMGIIANVRGEGMYIRNIEISDIISKLNFAFATTSNTLLDLVEVRDALETTAAYYAALRRTDDDIARLQVSLDMMENYSNDPNESKDPVKLTSLSHDFHNNLVKAAKNSVLSSVYESLFELLDISKQLTLANRSFDDHSQASHYEIFKRILLKDAEGARSCMMAHLDNTKKVLNKSIEEKKKTKNML